MAAGTITITVTESGKPDLTKTYSVPDVAAVTSAYQPLANTSLGLDAQGQPQTATRPQVWLYVAGTWKAALVSVVKQFQTVPAVIPPDINVT